MSVSGGFFHSYPYLAGSLILFLIFLAACPVAGKQRSAMLYSAFLSAPYAAASLIFVPHYWEPVRLFNPPVGIEDIVFSFSNGGIVWLLAVWPLRNELRTAGTISVVLKRYGIVTLCGAGLSTLMFQLGSGPMLAVLTSMGLLGLWLWYRVGQLRKLALWGALGFFLLYIALWKVTLLLWPDFLSQFNLKNLSGLMMFGIPVEEHLWALGFGAIWPFFMAYVLEADEIIKPPKADA